VARKRILILSATALLAILLTLGVTVFYFNLRPMPKLVTVTLENPPAAGTPEFRRTMESVLGRSILPGNRIEMLQNGEEIFPAMLEAIRSARRSITLESFEFFGDQIPAQFAEALAERAEAGVAVHVVLDFVGSRKADSEHFERMEEAGVRLVRWREPVWYQSSRYNFRTHRKLLVVDGKIGFTGGANLADPWLGNPESGGYRDNHFRLQGPIVAQLQAAFMSNWVLAEGELLLGEAYYPSLEEAGNTEIQLVQSSPREGSKEIRTCYLVAIAGARATLRLAAAYFYPDPDMLQALTEAATRGVEVHILMPGEETEKMFVRYASRNRWGPLLKAGAHIHEYDQAMYHAKVLIADESWASIGSANFDNRSFRINDETNLNIFASDFIHVLIEQFDADVAISTTYDFNRWAERPWHERFRGWLGNAIGPHL
jgi:cardiolipin synthase A/B